MIIIGHARIHYRGASSSSSLFKENGVLILNSILIVFELDLNLVVVQGFSIFDKVLSDIIKNIG
jgi:hypothetical protein